MSETPLVGGRVTPGVVLVGDTVRRPARPNSQLVRELLHHLEACGFDAAPRFLGTDERGREIFSFLPGDVPHELDPAIPDHALAAAARLIRRFHDATAGTPLSAGCPVVCHHDLSPCNFVFRDGVPVAIIDFDAAAPGERLQDVGMALFLWLNLASDGPPLDEQRRRIARFCREYGIEPTEQVVDAVLEAVRANVARLRVAGELAAADWWRRQLAWLLTHRSELAWPSAD